MARALKPIPLTKTTVLYTLKGTKALMTFLQSTNVATRQWILREVERIVQMKMLETTVGVERGLVGDAWLTLMKTEKPEGERRELENSLST